MLLICVVLDTICTRQSLFTQLAITWRYIPTVPFISLQLFSNRPSFFVLLVLPFLKSLFSTLCFNNGDLNRLQGHPDGHSIVKLLTQNKKVIFSDCCSLKLCFSSRWESEGHEAPPELMNDGRGWEHFSAGGSFKEFFNRDLESKSILFHTLEIKSAAPFFGLNHFTFVCLFLYFCDI